MHVLTSIVQALQYHLRSNWYILLIGVLLAVGINVYLDPVRLRNFLSKSAGFSIPGAVAFGALTPLCACGTMAVLVSMFATVMPWGAVLAFLVASPLTSPSDYMFQTAFLGTRFAVGMLASAIGLGLLAGLAAHLLERRTGFFRGQFRPAPSCCQSNNRTEVAAAKPDPTSCCTASEVSCCPPKVDLVTRLILNELVSALWEIGVKRILIYFILFISIGTVVQMLIPSTWIYMVFGGDKAHSIPLSAMVGLPLYVSSSSALPLLRSFIDAGAGEGAILAFLIAGKGTSVPVMLGMSTFLKPKVIALYALFVFFGSIAVGYLYQFVLIFMH
jgi:uncharacterized membrane protein YraQ (UPF0718 family)